MKPTTHTRIKQLLVASLLDLSGFIVLRALTQTAWCTTGPSSGWPFYV